MRRYTVSIVVSGCVLMEVMAESEAHAMELVADKYEGTTLTADEFGDNLTYGAPDDAWPSDEVEG